MWTMQRQLRLIDPEDGSWRLDEETRAVGRRGVAAARAALQHSRRPPDDGDDRRVRPTAA
jgi:hypothetical protein